MSHHFEEVHMISPPVYVYDAGGDGHAVFGWLVRVGAPITPIVANPDGPGVGAWHNYHGEDPWTTR